MKNTLIILAILSSSVVLAQQVRPQLYTFSNNVQVIVNNFTDESVSCSGFIYARTFRGFTETHYYNEIVYRKMSSFRNFYIRDFNDRYTYSYDNIFCNKY